MPHKTPSWWYRKPGGIAGALFLPAAIYGRVAGSRMARDVGHRSKLPVICVGNFTAGGGGKTPTAIAIATLLKAMGKRPAFLTRGYGGTAKGVVRVAGHEAHAVGDEPLLLAAVAPTFVSADRIAGAEAIEETDADVIVMDDGFQNPALAKDLSLIVVDAASGLGNGRVMPAGPLRAPLDTQMPRTDALLVIGDGKKADRLVAAFETAGKPVLRAKVTPNCDARWLAVLPVIGFAGIARPNKFFATLKSNGARLIESHSFRDHHRFTEKNARALLKEADEKKAMLVTTEKDWARIPDEDEDSALTELKNRSRPFPILVTFEDDEQAKDLLSALASR
ncbi:MAG: tetraacyldisaccharide 4'-kinase [Methyloceanibacter sp.]|jgi:tetraacyldisaccharide 4'-kinase|uniref:tetraacyldisaccharide 4'-kinase n=1 Tax=Methyloceanibacter sp. TaxID=1965321 RepID=UPI003567D3A1